jgi:hypothetical protein
MWKTWCGHRKKWEISSLLKNRLSFDDQRFPFSFSRRQDFSLSPTSKTGGDFAETSGSILQGNERMELRHQRNPDVIFDFVRMDKLSHQGKPALLVFSLSLYSRAQYP